MSTIALEIVKDWIWENLPKNTAYDLFIVWHCYILGNEKYMIGSSATNHYFEVTYSKEKNEWYLDVYDKIYNKVVKR